MDKGCFRFDFTKTRLDSGPLGFGDEIDFVQDHQIRGLDLIGKGALEVAALEEQEVTITLATDGQVTDVKMVLPGLACEDCRIISKREGEPVAEWRTFLFNATDLIYGSSTCFYADQTECLWD